MTDLNKVLGAYERGSSATLDAFGEACQSVFAPRLMTVFAWNSESDLCTRIWSNRPNSYPVPAEKKMGPTEWGACVLHAGEPWYGLDEAAIRKAFFDHEKILALGCGACLSAAIKWDGQIIGAVSVLDVEGAYVPTDADRLERMVAALVPVLLARR
ncbi:MAG: hypothetical protein EA345_16790 [Halomonas sp.]|nr:hypothetical protein [Halomonas sp.]TVP43529.1 MAG: hypothetical protein EA345_16790 [Halomonas sp.]